MKRVVYTLAAFVLAGLLMGCNLEQLAAIGRVTEDFHYSYQLDSGGKLSVNNFNGSIEIIGWEKDQVQISGTKYADTQEELKRLKIDVVSSGGNLRVQTIKPSDMHGGMGAKYVIRAPFKTDLDEVYSSNGSIRVEDLKGKVTLRTSNGSVHMLKLEGPLQVRTSNGKIDGDDLEGNADLETSNGSITLEHLHGAAEASTSNGSIRVAVSGPPSGQSFRLGTSNGSVDFSADRLDQNPVRIKTSNGSISVRLPASAGAQLVAEASHGEIENEFSVTGNVEQNKHRVEGQIGSGGALIQLETSNSPIRITKLTSVRED